MKHSSLTSSQRTSRNVVPENRQAGPSAPLHNDTALQPINLITIPLNCVTTHTSGASNMVLDVQVLEGNPSDAEILPNALDRVRAVTGRTPAQLAADGGFSSLDNVEFAKEFGVKDVAFSKHLGLEIIDMCKSVSAPV